MSTNKNLNKPGANDLANRRERRRAGASTSVVVILLALCVVVAGLLSSRPASAQESGSAAETGIARAENVEMVVRAGFGRLSVSNWTGSWVPFRISVVNQGPAIAGRIVVHCESSGSPNPQIREYVKAVQLATGSRQLHEIAAFLNSGENPIVRLESDSGVIIETKINVERSYMTSDQLEIAVIDTDSTTLNNIASAEIIRAPGREPFKAAARVPGQLVQPDVQVPPPGAQSPPQPPSTRRGRAPNFGRPNFQAHPNVITAEDLPREFISYDQLDAVVLGDAPLNQLSEEQARALRLWVASGGLLVVTGGADVSGLRAIGLEAIMPVEALATATVPSLPAFTDVYGSFDSPDQLTLMNARLKPEAGALLGTSSMPLVAESHYGSGSVRFLAINPKLNPYRAWSAAKDLWTDLLLPSAETKPKHVNWITVGRRGTSTSNRWGVQGFLFRLAEITPPSPKFVLLFLLAYILTLGPLNYFLLKWKRKTDLAWLTIPAVVITFAAVSVTVAQIGRGDASIIADSSLVELHQRDGVSRVSSGLLMMPATKRTQEVTFDGRDTYVNDVYNGSQSSSASAIGSIECERGTKELILRVPMTTWTSGLFQLRSIAENVPPMVSRSESSQTSIAIKNLSDEPISKAVYLSTEGISALFDVGPGREQRIDLAATPTSAFNSWYLTQFEQGSDESELLQELLPLLDREVGGASAFSQGFFGAQPLNEAIKRLERPLLIGFVEKGATGISLPGSFRRHSKVLYIVHL